MRGVVVDEFNDLESLWRNIMRLDRYALIRSNPVWSSHGGYVYSGYGRRVLAGAL